jgi:cold shock CspA family protein
MLGSTMQGQVKFFNREGNYGFVNLTEESGECVAEYFFHGVDVISDLPEKGDTVNFLLDDPPSRARRRDLIAVEVEKIAGSNTVAFAPDVFEKDLADEREEPRFNSALA